VLKFYCYAKFRYAECNCVECYRRKCSLSEVLHFQGLLSVLFDKFRIFRRYAGSAKRNSEECCNAK
jgi:hypothetical protein